VPLLELDGVGKTFGGLYAVAGVTVGADEGEILAIVGPNGAGKSTLLKLIVGLEKPSQGAVRFGGADITGLSVHRVRKRGIAMVQQHPRPFPTLTVLENVVLGAMFGGTSGHQDEAAALQTADEMLDFVGLEHRRHEPISNLNLHEQRFVELARGLAAKPRLFLLDEVMAGLNDAELHSSIEMVRAMRDRFGVTVVWVEHVMPAVMQLAERVVVIDFGQVLAEGPADLVMRDERVIEAYLGAGAIKDA
jgi:ABC-type branched-subunit amino acid transport system ATPase component